MKASNALVGAIACVLCTSVGHAAMPVVDIRAIVQMAQQLQVLQNQLTTARNQLTQAQQQFQSLTGQRGMEQLLSGVASGVGRGLRDRRGRPGAWMRRQCRSGAGGIT